MKNCQRGFGAIGVLLVVVIIGIVGGTGWYVWSQRPADTVTKSESNESVKEEQAPSEESKIPEGWVQYEDSSLPLSFYYPKDWAKDKFEVKSFEKFGHLNSGYGAPVGHVFDQGRDKWVRYLNYGTEHQKEVKEGEDESEGFNKIKTTTTSGSDYPVAYFQNGHAGVITHDILVVGKTNSYRIRLPEINSMQEEEASWRKKLAEQEAAIKQIIESIKIKN